MDDLVRLVLNQERRAIEDWLIKCGITVTNAGYFQLGIDQRADETIYRLYKDNILVSCMTTSITIKEH